MKSDLAMLAHTKKAQVLMQSIPTIRYFSEYALITCRLSISKQNHLQVYLNYLPIIDIKTELPTTNKPVRAHEFNFHPQFGASKSILAEKNFFNCIHMACCLFRLQ
ncbi:hypothetical protein ACOSP7_002476 [Xanthoceras sorbifolium]